MDETAVAGTPGTAGTASPGRTPAPTASGPGRILVTVYAIFAVAACSRSVVQIATEFDHARLAYLLSAFAAVVYVVATIALTRRGPGWHRLAVLACATELVGVLAVGTASVVHSQSFPDAAVWSRYGSGYLFIPVILPILGLTWLRRTRAASTAVADTATTPGSAGGTAS